MPQLCQNLKKLPDAINYARVIPDSKDKNRGLLGGCAVLPFYFGIILPENGNTAYKQGTRIIYFYFMYICNGNHLYDSIFHIIINRKEVYRPEAISSLSSTLHECIL